MHESISSVVVCNIYISKQTTLVTFLVGVEGHVHWGRTFLLLLGAAHARHDGQQQGKAHHPKHHAGDHSAGII